MVACVLASGCSEVIDPSLPTQTKDNQVKEPAPQEESTPNTSQSLNSSNSWTKHGLLVRFNSTQASPQYGFSHHMTMSNDFEVRASTRREVIHNYAFAHPIVLMDNTPSELELNYTLTSVYVELNLEQIQTDLKSSTVYINTYYDLLTLGSDAEDRKYRLFEISTDNELLFAEYQFKSIDGAILPDPITSSIQDAIGLSEFRVEVDSSEMKTLHLTLRNKHYVLEGRKAHQTIQLGEKDYELYVEHFGYHPATETLESTCCDVQLTLIPTNWNLPSSARL